MNADPPGPTQLALQLMTRFASDTGLVGEAEPRRYLWTDAFAVTNYLGLARLGALPEGLELALALVDQVHHGLGRHRGDDGRRGWISGLSDAQGELHPTQGGLRIGKALPERGPDEPHDARREWDRDGQYFHYLTQWIHALERVSEETGQALFHRWAVELAQRAHRGFVWPPSPATPRGMVWKMSIDLSRPLVPSMGHHDPLEAWLTYLELSRAEDREELAREIEQASALAVGSGWETEDALGIGGLLTGIFRLVRVMAGQSRELNGLLDRLLAASRRSLAAFSLVDPTTEPVERRLAFRELGLAIGLHAVARIDGAKLRGDHREAVAEIAHHLPLARRIDEFWSEPAHRQSHLWQEHKDINTVMLATSLCPEGHLGRP